MERVITYKEKIGRVSLQADVDLDRQVAMITTVVDEKSESFEADYERLFEIFPFMQDIIPEEDQ